MTFYDLEQHDTFKLHTEFGSADFIKQSFNEALCLDSKEATYEKNRLYIIQCDDKVELTC